MAGVAIVGGRKADGTCCEAPPPVVAVCVPCEILSTRDLRWSAPITFDGPEPTIVEAILTYGRRLGPADPPEGGPTPASSETCLPESPVPCLDFSASPYSGYHVWGGESPAYYSAGSARYYKYRAHLVAAPGLWCRLYVCVFTWALSFEGDVWNGPGCSQNMQGVFPDSCDPFYFLGLNQYSLTEVA